MTPHLLKIVRHPVTPDRRLAVLDDGKIIAAFESVPGTSPDKRLEDARDFCRQLNRRFITSITAPSKRP